ncbi:hypothetical protein HJG60_011253 [Phyllostomus discolor]|uniref:Uncharacterized protein n=1 Tax=Phyllostomus discolor TaxID=89673 RepID=A0A834A4E8_9CHIR|nr:hypothetical protein HJG60_011253 [Phyllostomus discolor]
MVPTLPVTFLERLSLPLGILPSCDCISSLPHVPRESTCILGGFRKSSSLRRCQCWSPGGAIGGGRCHCGLSYPGLASAPPLVPPEVGGVARRLALGPSPRSPAAPSPRSARSGASRPSPSFLPGVRNSRGMRGRVHGLGAAMPGGGS